MKTIQIAILSAATIGTLFATSCGHKSDPEPTAPTYVAPSK